MPLVRLPRVGAPYARGAEPLAGGQPRRAGADPRAQLLAERVLQPVDVVVAHLPRLLDAKDDPQRLQVVYNTLFGRLWEDRGDLVSDDEMMARREDYGTRPDGTPVELPDGALVVTVGVDVQGHAPRVRGGRPWALGRDVGRGEGASSWAVPTPTRCGGGWTA